MRVAYFDCFSGASGDMILGALLDAGASLDRIRDRLASLPISGWTIGASRLRKQGLAATQFEVQAEEDQPHRHLHNVVEIIRAGKLPEWVCGQACRIFTRLAEAEAAVHATTVEKVHFHEVGAIDAIIDVVGACLALADLGVQEVLCSPIPTGSGAVQCQHGLMPVPAPATAELLRGVPLAACDEIGELTTPTGAAILTSLAQRFTTVPEMTLRAVGYGAGRRDGRVRPNLLRVLLGDASGSDASNGTTTDEIAVLQAGIDDQSPEELAFATTRLLEAGALDAYCQPVYMKKGRPGLLLTVLCRPEHVGELEAVIFAQTTTFGVRSQYARRRKLERRTDRVQLEGGIVRIKVGLYGGRVATAAPEYEDCRQLAEQRDVPLKEVMASAMSAWRAAGPCGGSCA